MLASVLKRYGFQTETWLVPLTDTHLRVASKTANFVQQYDAEDCLLIGIMEVMQRIMISGASLVLVSYSSSEFSGLQHLDLSKARR
jgi:hypothetical protein